MGDLLADSSLTDQLLERRTRAWMTMLMIWVRIWRERLIWPTKSTLKSQVTTSMRILTSVVATSKPTWHVNSRPSKLKMLSLSPTSAKKNGNSKSRESPINLSSERSEIAVKNGAHILSKLKCLPSRFVDLYQRFAPSSRDFKTMLLVPLIRSLARSKSFLETSKE